MHEHIPATELYIEPSQLRLEELYKMCLATLSAETAVGQTALYYDIAPDTRIHTDITTGRARYTPNFTVRVAHIKLTFFNESCPKPLYEVQDYSLGLGSNGYQLSGFMRIIDKQGLYIDQQALASRDRNMHMQAFSILAEATKEETALQLDKVTETDVRGLIALIQASRPVVQH